MKLADLRQRLKPVAPVMRDRYTFMPGEPDRNGNVGLLRDLAGSALNFRPPCQLPEVCEYCLQLKEGVGPVPAMTAYAWDGKGEDPNRSPWLCKECEEEYVAFWDERWKEYHSDIL